MIDWIRGQKCLLTLTYQYFIHIGGKNDSHAKINKLQWVIRMICDVSSCIYGSWPWQKLVERKGTYLRIRGNGKSESWYSDKVQIWSNPMGSLSSAHGTNAKLSLLDFGIDSHVSVVTSSSTQIDPYRIAPLNWGQEISNGVEHLN